MNERYTITITKNPSAGPEMISILIIDTKPEDGKSEVYSATIHRSKKISSLFPYMEKFGSDFHLVDISR